MWKKIWILPTIIFILVLAGCGQGIKDPLNWEINDFTSVNQNGKEVDLTDLKGKVWIADFIYTTCTTACPPLTANLVKIQKKLKDKGLNTEIVSFSIDPKVDTPDVLKKYAEKFNPDLSNWNLLTGYTQQFIEDFAHNDFKTIVKKPDSGNVIAHGTSFYLVDKSGKIVKSYSGLYDVPYDDIIRDVKVLTD